MSSNATSVYYDVYLGAWTNWSRGQILGATLTVTRINGTILIAFAAFFLTLVLGRFWALGCMLLHWLFSTPMPRDVVHHQSQVILRNSSSPQEGLWTYIRLFWASRQTTGRVLRRTWPAWVFALFCIGAFAAATYFLPMISSENGAEVLLTGKNCGLFIWTRYNLSDVTLLWTPYLASKIFNAESYARNCYSGSDGALGCEKFPVVEVPVTTNTNAKCPFAPEMCRNQDSNLILDTGLLDTNDHFGLSAPANERVLFRKVLHCAPLVTEGYTKPSQSPSRNLTQYLYGVSNLSGNFVNVTSNITNEVDDLDAQYYDYQYVPFAGKTGNYRLLVSYSNVAGNQTQPAVSSFLSIPQLFREDGDTLLVLLVSGGIISSAKSDDPWYRFNVQTPSQTVKIGVNTTTAPTYRMEEAASPLGCVQQYQFCNSALGKESGCGPLASANDAMDGAFGLFNTEEEQARLAWTYMMMSQGYYLSNILKQLGPQSLLSQQGLFTGRQGPIPANQWQLDVNHWFATSLAAMQAAYIDAANGATDPRLQPYAEPEYEDESHKYEYKETLCKTQKMQSIAHMSFSLFGLVFIFVTGGIIIVMPNALEALFAYFSKSKASRRYTYLEWTSNQTLQLHRLAHEGRGWGSWFHATDYIPVTNANENLACLDLSDPEHPIYRDLEDAHSNLATDLTLRSTTQTTEEGWYGKLEKKNGAYEHMASI